MQHQQAVEEHLVEQYLLNEMSSERRDEFEEHFFECGECAAELRATSAFLDATRAELKRTEAPDRQTFSDQVVRPAEKEERRHWWTALWNPAFGFAAAAACLLVILYQNAVVLPKLNTEVARLEAPQILPTLSLAGAASRGENAPALSVAESKDIVLLVDIPAQTAFTGYRCELLSLSQGMLWVVQVTPEQAKDTVALRIPSAGLREGQYALVVRGTGQAGDAELARLPFTLTASH